MPRDDILRVRCDDANFAHQLLQMADDDAAVNGTAAATVQADGASWQFVAGRRARRPRLAIT